MYLLQFFIYFLVFVFLAGFNLARLDGDSFPYVTNLWYQTFEDDIKFNRGEEIAVPSYKERFFISKSRLAYLDGYGKIIHLLHLDANTYIAPAVSAYLFFHKTQEEIGYYDIYGAKRWTLNLKGYPFLSPNATRILILSTDNFYLTLYNQNRQLLLPRTFMGGVVTDIDFSDYEEDFIVGSMSGDIMYYTRDGSLLFKRHVGGSEYNYVKDVEVSKQGNFVVSLSGLYPEYLSLFSRSGELKWERETGYSRRSSGGVWLSEERGEVYELLPAGVLRVRSFEGGVVVRDIDIMELIGLKEKERGELDYMVYDQKGSLLALGLMLEDGFGEKRKRFLLMDLGSGEVYFKKSFRLISRLELFIESGQVFLLMNTGVGSYQYQLHL